MKTSDKRVIGIFFGIVILIGVFALINYEIEQDQLHRAELQGEVSRSEAIQKDRVLELEEQHAAITAGRESCYEKFQADEGQKSVYADTSVEKMRAICNQ